MAHPRHPFESRAADRWTPPTGTDRGLGPRADHAGPLLRWGLCCVLAACGDTGAPSPDPAAAPEVGTEPEARAQPETRAEAELEAAEVDDAPRTRVVLLGTGTPEPDPARSGPCTAVVVDDAVYLVDAGPGVVRRAEEASAVTTALHAEALTHVFLTHLHSDHTLGLPDLIFSPWVVSRARPLVVYGPPGTEAMVARILAAWVEDVAIRTEGLEGAAPEGWRAEAHDVSPGEVYSDERVTVTAFSVDHGSWRHALGYRLEGPDRTVVVSGDTRPTDAVSRACAGCDVLVHEVYSAAGLSTRPASAQRYHRAFHTSGVELAELATRARPRRLVLTHHLLFGVSPDELMREVTAGYDGEVRFGRDLETH